MAPRLASALLLLLGIACGDATDDGGPDVPELPAHAPTGVADISRVLPGLFDAHPELARGGVHLEQPPGDARWVLATQDGVIYRLPATDDAAPTVLLDLGERIWTGDEEAGLSGMAFHPDFATNGRLVVVYDVWRDGQVARLAEFTMDGDDLVNPGSERVLLELPQPRPTHSLNDAVYGPDGMLYLGVGDGGFAYRPDWAQDTSNLYGAVLRIDPDAPAAERAYGIPSDNPFAEGGGAPELYAWGLRNPWRFSFDPITGDLWLGDVGAGRREEIDRVEPGHNYGWPITEGFDCFEASTCDRAGLSDPIADYTHVEGKSVTGGHVYRGGDLPDLVGDYVFADFISGRVFRLDAGARTYDELVATGFNISHVARDHAGEIYLLRYGFADEGGIYKLVPRSPVPDPHRPASRLSETGLVDVADLGASVAGVVPYEVNAALWSDGAAKLRAMALPADTTATPRAGGDLRIPRGATLVKHFLSDGMPIETRLLVHAGDGEWRGYSYRWRDDSSDADLLPGGLVRTLPDGTRWQYPSSSQCFECHTALEDTALGPTLPQLDRGDQLQRLVVAGVLDAAELEAADWTALPAPHGAGPIEARAKAYLDANCAHCHQPGGPAQGDADLRMETPWGQMGLCSQQPQVHDLWTLGSELVTPGDADNSVLYLRLVDTGDFRMPPLSTHLVDEAAAELVRAWIDGMDGCP